MSIVPGRDVPAVPEAWVDAVNKAINDANHEDLCNCDGWPDACRSYKPGLWDIGVDLDIAIGVLEPLIRENIAPELTLARSLRIARHSIESLVDPQIHTPARVGAYLKAHGWEMIREYPSAELWRHETLTRPGWAETGSVVRVFTAAEWRDYADQIAGLVVDLAGLHGAGELGVLADIAEAGDA